MPVAFAVPAALASRRRALPLRAAQPRMSASAPRPIPGGGVTAARGFRAGGATAGFKPSGLPDLAVVVVEGGRRARGAGVFTQNCVRAAPVDVAAAALEEGGGRVAAIVVNSGQANASTGRGGADDAAATVRAAAAAVGCAESEVLIASTGMIGRRMDVGKMEAALPAVVSAARADAAGGAAAARAIMTTDLVQKEAAFEAEVGGRTVRVGGMAKGSGMIHPNMATMLAFVTCDATVERGLWQAMVSRAADASFNMITVDGDTSTNDVLFALCADDAAREVAEAGSADAAAVEGMVTAVCVSLAKQIARDGEGATVLVEVRVTGASDDAAARAIARAVAGSSLTKAAVCGRDPNWGRISAAAGRAGVALDARRMGVAIGPHVLMRGGEPVAYDAAAASAYMAGKAAAGAAGYCSAADTVVLEVRLGDGAGAGVAWGCDLTKEYVAINSEYST